MAQHSGIEAEDRFVVYDTVQGEAGSGLDRSTAVKVMRAELDAYREDGWTVEEGRARGDYTAARVFKDGRYERYVSIEREQSHD